MGSCSIYFCFLSLTLAKSGVLWYNDRAACVKRGCRIGASERESAGRFRGRMRKMIICDTHADTLYRRFRQATGAEKAGAPCDITNEKLRAGGVSVQTMALYVGASPKLEDIEKAFHGMWAQGEELEKSGLKRVNDYRDAKEGENAFIYSVEGCDLLNGSLEPLAQWRARGVRMAALTWNYENCVATPAKLDSDAPLKPFGKKAAKEMARLGIAPDTSHLNQRGFYDLLEMGLIPLASHSCCRALCDHCRNLTDRQLKDLFRAGGYVGVNFYPFFLRQDGKADLDAVCDHVIHILELGGEEHVGFGSDFDGIEHKPEGLNGPQDLPALLKRLEERGVSQAQLKMIAGENLLRYFDRIDPRKEKNV